ncbi:uncharacterized protein [Amphiura filiformis]|uniref:uncharacterized protein n=1 Tax=Amphiura filiformis TaxID=82378 RepID=UPI003B20DEE6
MKNSVVAQMKLDARFINNDCSRECECNAGGKIKCKNYKCRGEQKCSVFEGVRGCHQHHKFHTNDKYDYKWKFDRLSKPTRVLFKAKAKNDVHIALSPKNAAKKEMYEIVIGGWSNSKSVIRRRKQGRPVVEHPEKGILDPREFREFIVDFDGSTLKVSKGGAERPFLKFTDEDPIEIHHIGVTTGWKSDGDFVFYDLDVKSTIEECVCSAWGDPHFTTCDKRTFNYMGKCVYVTAETCRGDGPWFRIEERHIPYIKNKRAATTKELYILTNKGKNGKYKTEYRLKQKKVVEKRVKDNGKTVFETVNPPFDNIDKEDGVTLSMAGKNVELTTGFGLKVSFDGKYDWKVHIPGKYKKNICGLCGNWDGDKKNDFTLPDGSVARDENTFGNAWVSKRPEHGCVDVPKEPKGETDLCKGTGRAKQAAKICGILDQSVNNRALKRCFEGVDTKELFETCKQDVCATPDKEEQKRIRCASIEEFADSCKEKGTDLGNWRSPKLCPMKCGKHATYSSNMSPCQPTCLGDSPLGSLDNCPDDNKEGCKCDDGFVLSGEDCVSQDECGCQGNDGSYIKQGEEYVGESCKQCTCSEKRILKCVKCPGGKCRFVKGVRKCLKKPEVQEESSEEKEPTENPSAGTEIALMKGKAEQSSLAHGGKPDRAIDGKTDGEWGKNSCTHTKSEKGAWWSVDMGKAKCVGKVVIYNRKDCCKERLKGARIHVGSDKNRNNPVCGIIKAKDIKNKSVLEVSCNLKGRYLSVSLPGKDYLTLCEVKAFAGDCDGGK